MRNIVILTILNVLALAMSVNSQTYLQKVTGNWEGTLEYLDYSDGKSRVKLKTYLTITPSSDGNSAEFATIYDDFGKIIKESETVKIDLAAKNFVWNKTEYLIESIADGKIVLLGRGQDGEKVEPMRETITFSDDSLDFLKETRSPWQFRHQMTFKRTAEKFLEKKILSAAQLKEDFGIFKKALTTIHPGIYRYQTPASLAKAFGELESGLKNSLPESEFFKLLSQITAQIYCGHTYLNPYNQDSLVRERVFNDKTYFPLYFQIIEGKMIATENASGQPVKKGSEITSINGVPVKEIIETLLTVTKADGRNTLIHRLKSIELNRFEAERYTLFDWYFPLFFPIENGRYDVEVVDAATKKSFKFQTPAMLKTERTAEMEKLYGKTPTYDDDWKFEIRENATAYLKIPNSITWRLKKIKFKEFIATAFAEMRFQNVKNLIIDLRGNGGGDMNVGYELARHLAKEKLPVYAESRRLVRTVAAQPDLAKYLDTYDDNLKLALQNGVSANAFKKTENGFFEILPNNNLENFPNVVPAESYFSGKTYIIADASNASATFQFLDYVRANKLAIIVGQESGGNRQGINGGSYFFLRLPNSKFEIDIPVYYQAPLTAQKDAGVIPDVNIKAKVVNVEKEIDGEMLAVKKLIARN